MQLRCWLSVTDPSVIPPSEDCDFTDLPIWFDDGRHDRTEHLISDRDSEYYTQFPPETSTQVDGNGNILFSTIKTGYSTLRRRVTKVVLNKTYDRVTTVVAEHDRTGVQVRTTVEFWDGRPSTETTNFTPRDQLHATHCVALDDAMEVIPSTLTPLRGVCHFGR